MRSKIMKIQEGDHLEEISLPTIKGTHFSTQELHHKRYLLTFYRFASCPLCNLRIHQFIKRYDELNKDFTMVAIFHSSSENLNRHMTRHQAPFPILADKDLHYFKKYQVDNFPIIVSVAINSPAYDADLQEGDIVLEINNLKAD